MTTHLDDQTRVIAAADPELAAIPEEVRQQAAYNLTDGADPGGASPQGPGDLPGADAGQYQRSQAEEAAQFQRFQAAEAARAVWDQAMHGNGSDNPFVRWLTRKPLPVKMTGYRILCGLCWALWTIVFSVGTFAEPGFGHVVCLVLAVLSGLYDWRIWTRRARRLSLLIIF